MGRRPGYWGGLLLLLALPAMAAEDVDRGRLLYATHCTACHSTAMHWRDQKLARDFSSLKEQVRRWQAMGKLNWSEADILLVARYLNDNYYHFSGQEAVGLLHKPAGE